MAQWNRNDPTASRPGFKYLVQHFVALGVGQGPLRGCALDYPECLGSALLRTIYDVGQNDLTSLCFSFFICEMRKITVAPTSMQVVR